MPDTPSPPPSTVRDWLTRAAARLDEGRDAEWLLGYVLQQDRAWLFAHATDPLPCEQARVFEQLVTRRAQGEPVAYLTGHQGFWSLDLCVTPDTLIPRPQTERLVEQALARLPAGTAATVVDLGTGSGAVALAIASERPLAQVVATDASRAALAVAQTNARRLGLHNVSFRQGDWLAPLVGQRFDLIVSNPPYIETGDDHLQQGDLRFEPARALASGPDGLDALGIITTDAADHLTPGGWLLLEHGWHQGEAVHALLRKAGYAAVTTVKDLGQRDRVTLGLSE